MGTRGALVEARLAEGLTQQTLAERTGLALRTIQKLEAGASPNIRTALRIARELNRAVEDLFPELYEVPA